MPNLGRTKSRILGLLVIISGLTIAAIPAGPAPAVAAAGVVCTRTTAYLGTKNGDFLSVAAISPTDVWVLGGAAEVSAYHWDGKHWRTFPTPRMHETSLRSISAVGPNDVWAVGSLRSGGDSYIVAEHWNGRQWQIVSTLAAQASNTLGIAARAATNVWVVGAVAGPPTLGTPVIKHWDGQQWSGVPIAAAEQHLVEARYTVQYDAVAALAPDAAWIVGMEDNNGPAALFDYWNGRTWQPAPGPRFSYVELSGIAPVTRTDVWAVGAHGDPAGVPYTPYIVHWDGRQAREVHGVYVAPDRSKGSGLSSVVALSATDVWAVGSLVERWDGVRWRAVPVPKGEGFSAVAAAGPHDIWMVGSRGYDSDHYVPVVEHFHGPGC